MTGIGQTGKYMSEQKEQPGTVLIVDDTPENVSLLVAVLSADYTIITATRGSEALKIVRERPPDLILLDIMMPEMNGYEFCERLKNVPHAYDIPVIFLSMLDTTEVKLLAFKSGAVDYITKPFHAREVQARVKTHLMIRQLQHKLEAQNLILKQSHTELARLAMIVDSSNDAIFTVSTDDVITSWNGGAEDIFGYSAREIIGNTVFTILPGEDYPEKSHNWQTILSGDHIRYFETSRAKSDGSRRYVSITTSPLLNAEWVIIGNSVIARDVTERRTMEETIKHQAHHDTLTTLPNRQFFMDILTLGLAQARRSEKMLALLFMDLNGFKLVNDTYGHNCGDRLLQEVAQRLKTSIRESDTVARLGGDEFTVMMPDINHTEDVHIILKKILGVFESPFLLDGVAIESATSIGVSIFPDDGDSSEIMMKNADKAMYEAKGSGRNSFRFYNPIKST
jgi:diguanylate cyclase (GGDEF)-like protein/PAS domain S-box-containing protein